MNISITNYTIFIAKYSNVQRDRASWPTKNTGSVEHLVRLPVTVTATLQRLKSDVLLISASEAVFVKPGTFDLPPGSVCCQRAALGQSSFNQMLYLLSK